MTLAAVPDRLPVSVIVLTYNEEHNLEDCLRSVAGWAGEIVVVDSGSTDATRAIARRYADRVVEHPFDDYSQQRNWAQDTLPLRHAWVLHLDADERVTRELAASIAAFFRSGEAERANGAMFSRRTVFMRRWIRHGGHYPVFHTRLFRKNRGRCEDRLYDQHFLVAEPVVKLSGDLIDILTSELDEWSRRHIRWAGAEAQEMSRPVEDRRDQVASSLSGGPIARRRWLRTGLFGRSPLFVRAFLYFAYRYIVRLGFLDGTEGLIYHFLHACWFRFYVDAKMWEASRRGAHQQSHSLPTDRSARS
jgi:glycosyltransferase involved in cell wall biosynthesis